MRVVTEGRPTYVAVAVKASSPLRSTGALQKKAGMHFWDQERFMQQAVQLIRNYWLRLTLWVAFLLGRILA
jgi:hypothetical protein